MKQKTHICFVGQGPNRTCWNVGMEMGRARFGAEGTGAEDFATKRAKRLALTGSVGQKLARLLGMPLLEFCVTFRRENLNARFNGKSGKGDAFNAPEGRLKAAMLLADPSIKKFVCLGEGVAKCFYGGHVGKLEIVKVTNFCEPARAIQILFLPHPSGINSWYNKEDNLAAASSALLNFTEEFTSL